MKKTINNNKGFTLIELIIVTMILGVLAAVAVPRYMGSVSNAEAGAEASTVAAMRAAVENYAMQKFLETGRYEYPKNPFDYLEVDSYTTMDNWEAEDVLALPIGSWAISPDWDDLEGIEGMGAREIFHKRRDGNLYWWSYYYGDLTDLDADDRGANVGLYPENPAQWAQDEFDLFHDSDGEDGPWVGNGHRDIYFTSDTDPATDGF